MAVVEILAKKFYLSMPFRHITAANRALNFPKFDN